MSQEPSPESSGIPFLLGGGEMGAPVRAMDWAKTSLGPAEQWPQSLKTAVRIMLTSRQAMFVWWGDELINLYNDAYKAIVGGKHPEALGQPASVVWRGAREQGRAPPQAAGGRPAGLGGVAGDLGSGQAPRRVGDALERGDLRRGPAAHHGAQRLSG